MATLCSLPKWTGRPFCKSSVRWMEESSHSKMGKVPSWRYLSFLIRMARIAAFQSVTSRATGTLTHSSRYSKWLDRSTKWFWTIWNVPSTTKTQRASKQQLNFWMANYLKTRFCKWLRTKTNRESQPSKIKSAWMETCSALSLVLMHNLRCQAIWKLPHLDSLLQTRATEEWTLKWSQKGGKIWTTRTES